MDAVVVSSRIIHTYISTNVGYIFQNSPSPPFVSVDPPMPSSCSFRAIYVPAVQTDHRHFVTRVTRPCRTQTKLGAVFPRASLSCSFSVRRPELVLSWLERKSCTSFLASAIIFLPLSQAKNLHTCVSRLSACLPSHTATPTGLRFVRSFIQNRTPPLLTLPASQSYSAQQPPTYPFPATNP